MAFPLSPSSFGFFAVGMKAEELFSIPDSFPFKTYFSPESAPWQWLPNIQAALSGPEFAPNAVELNELPTGVVVAESVYIHPSVSLSPNVVIEGPAYIGEGTEIRPGVYIRGNVITGKGCVLGNSSEFKNSLLFDDVQAPHFNYVGDSVLGNGVHLGAGVICSNLRLDQINVWVKLPGGSVDSGLRKLGALVGDNAEVGCNTVLNPGAVLGKRSLVYPSMAFSGVLESDSIATVRQEQRIIKRR